ncbi:MAG: Gfo/Idh/MocA family protein [Clostridiaceae bacterium]
MSKHNKVKIGICGCGWIAENAHIPALIKNGHVEITSVFDFDLNRSINIANKFKIKSYFDSFDDFLNSDIDAVIISTPNYSHGEYILRTLEKGKHVLCEKPFTVFLEETKEIITLANKNKKIVMPGFVNRFRYDIEKMRQIILDNDIGDIKKIEAGWVRRSGVPRPGTWFTNKKLSGGGVLIDLGSHIIDLCLMLLSDKNIKEKALTTSYNYTNNSELSASWFKRDTKNNLTIDVEESALSEIVFQDKVLLQVKLSWLASKEGDFTYFKIYGENGEVELKTLFGFSNDRLWEGDSLFIKKDNESKTIYFNKEENNAMLAFSSMMTYFINSINGEDMNFLNLEDAYNTVNLIEQLYQCEVKKLDPLEI